MDTAANTRPQWLALLAVTVAFAGLFALAASPRHALYWYIFPLFGLGACYLVQFRAELPTGWKVAFGCSAVLSAVALALNWPFSGHVLWNVLFIGHAWHTGKRRGAWMGLLLASLVYLFVMKVVSQAPRDVVGGFISIAVAAVLLFVLSRTAPPTAPPAAPAMAGDDEPSEEHTGRRAREHLRTVVALDFRTAPWGRRLALLAVCGWLAYEWGPGNEILTPWVLVRVFAATKGWVAIVATTAAGFLFTATQQFVSGVTALVGFSMFERTSAASWRLLQRRQRSAVPEWSQSGWGTRFALVFALGTTAVALVQIVATGRTGVRRHLPVIAASAALNASAVAVFTVIPTTLAVLAARVPSFTEPTGRVVADLSNPLVWLGVGAIVMGVSVVRSGRAQPDPEPEPEGHAA